MDLIDLNYCDPLKLALEESYEDLLNSYKALKNISERVCDVVTYIVLFRLLELLEDRAMEEEFRELNNFVSRLIHDRYKEDLTKYKKPYFGILTGYHDILESKLIQFDNMDYFIKKANKGSGDPFKNCIKGPSSFRKIR